MTIEWPVIFKTIKEQSPYYNMTFAIILFIIIICPFFVDAEILNRFPGFVEFRIKYFTYIMISFIICFVFGGGQFAKKIVD